MGLIPQKNEKITIKGTIKKYKKYQYEVNNGFKNSINISYYSEKVHENNNNIFGKKFVENNKNNIDLYINGTKMSLVEKNPLKMEKIRYK